MSAHQNIFNNDGLYQGSELVEQKEDEASQIWQDAHKNRPIQASLISNNQSNQWQEQNYQAYKGEIIHGKMFTYHSISELESLINENQALSLDTEGSTGKVLQSNFGSVFALSQEDNDMQLLINQEELIKNLLAPFKSHTSSDHPSSLPALTNPILDFALCTRNRLYLLYPEILTVLDLSNLFPSQKNALLVTQSPSKTMFDSQPDFLDCVQFPQSGLYNSVQCETLNSTQHLLLYNTKSSSILTHLSISLDQIEQQQLVSDNFEQDQVQYKLSDNLDRTIQDVQVCGSYVCILMERNEIQVVDLKQQQVVFKAQYKDTSAKIVKAYYIDPNAKFNCHNISEQSVESESQMKQEDVLFKREGQKRLALFRDATIKEHSPENALQQPLNGYFLFVENLITKDQGTLKPHTQFEKISIAKIINKPTGNPQKAFDQRLQQLDYLKISEKSRKIIDFDQERGIIFLMNNKVSTISSPISKQCIKIYTVQLKKQYTQQGVNNSDSDNEDSMKISSFINESQTNEAIGIKFSFIKGIHLMLNSQVIHHISTAQSSSAKRPKFFKILAQINKTEDNQNCITYCLYTSIGRQILAHKLSFDQDLTHSVQQPKQNSDLLPHSLNFSLHPQSSSHQITASHQNVFEAPYQQESQSIFGQDLFFSIAALNNNSESDSVLLPSYELNVIQPSIQFGAPQSQDQQLDGDELQNEVKREIQEAIEKEMQDISLTININDQCQIINEADEEVMHNQSQIRKVNEEEEKQVFCILDSQQITESSVKYSTGKEIKVSVDTFKMIQAVKQGTQINATEKKKKKKQKQKTTTTAIISQGNILPTITSSVTQFNEESKPIPMQISTVLANQMPFNVLTGPQVVPVSQQQVQAYQPKALNISSNGILRIQPSVQQSQISAATIQGKKQQISFNQTPTVQQKTQEDSLIDTFSELTKKYSDLSQKFQKLQDQLSSQNQQQAELDRCIAKNIGQVIPSVIESQFKEKMAPMVIAHMKGIDKNIRDEVLPQVQSQIQEIISKLVRQNKIQILSQQEEDLIKKRGLTIDECTQNEIKQLVIEEFVKAMEQGIKPILQEQFAGIVTEVKSNLKFLNNEIAQKFIEEQEKNNEVLKQLQLRMDAIQSQNQNQSMYPTLQQQPPTYHQYPMYGSYPYPPYYPPPPNHYPGSYYSQPLIHGSQMNYYGYQPQQHSSHSDQRLAEINITPQNSLLYPGSHPTILSHNPSLIQPMIAQPLTQNSSSGTVNFSPLNIPPSFGSHPNQNYFTNTQPAFTQNQQFNQQTPSYTSALPQNHHEFLRQQQQPTSFPIVKNQEIVEEAEQASTPKSTMEENKTEFPLNQMKIKGEKIIKKEKSISSNGSTPNEEHKESPTKKKGKQTFATSQKYPQLEQVIDSAELQTFAQNKKWQILPYMKEVATQGKSSSADFLLCGSQEFLQDTVQFVSENSHIITNQYSHKIIHQFIKKVYTRAKENERARKGAVIIIGIFIEKIYRVRDNMKQLVLQGTQMEQEIKKLIEED